jgi:predicted AAA+ superfamily ATPase
MEFGGMGIIIPFINNVTETKNILNTVYADAIEKDLKYRHPIKNNVEFKKICSYFFNNIGNKISINNLAKYFHSNNESKITKVTINKYIQ